MGEVNYGIIHEIGEYSDIEPLNENDNKILNERNKEKNKNDE